MSADLVHRCTFNADTASQTFDDSPGQSDSLESWEQSTGDWVRSQDGSLSAESAGEALLLAKGMTLGQSYSLRARLQVPATPKRVWAGLGFNIQPSGDMHVLSVARGAGEESAHWHLGLSSGQRGRGQMIACGRIPVAQGEELSLAVTTVDEYGRVRLDIEPREGEAVSVIARPAYEEPLFGGGAGLYAGDAGAVFHEAVFDTSGAQAVPPKPREPLLCHPHPNANYELPRAALTVTETHRIDDTWAGHAVRQSILTDGAQAPDTRSSTGTGQYVAYFDANSQMCVAHRGLGSEDWTIARLDNHIGWDSHNYVTMALDPAGNLHVSGNLHVDPMIYYRTTTPGDVRSLQRVHTLVDASHEQRVTYPEFLRLPSGQLVFNFRDGSSGDGVTYYYLYDHEERTWSSLVDSQMFDGEGLRNAYVWGPVAGPDGYFHMTWVWRETPDAATNSRLSYLRSTNLRDWETAHGSPVSLPLSYDGDEVIIDDVPTRSGMLNGLHTIGFDGDGRPVIAFHKYDADGDSQLYVARPTSETWQIEQITQWSGQWDFSGGGSLANEVHIDAIWTLPDGKLALPIQCHGQHRVVVVDPATLTAVAEVVDPPPAVPPELADPENDFPGIEVQWGHHDGEPAAQRYVLRWEALPPNRDLPRVRWPEPVPLMLYGLRDSGA